MKRFLLPFAAVMAITLLSGVTIHAQSPTPNIATSAICTHSGGGSGVYGPQNYNDGVIPAQGNLPWGWTSGGSTTGTGNWIMFEWPSAQTFGEVTLYHGEINRRYLTGGTIQYWNATGGVWVDHHNWLNPAPYTNWTTIIQFPPATSTRMRITRWVMAPVGQTSNPNFREIEVRNICTDPPTDVSFSTNATTTQPGLIPIHYSVGRPIGQFTATITMNFKTPQDVLVHSETTTVDIDANTVTGTYYVSSDLLPPGFYILEVVFNVMDICNEMADVTMKNVVMVLSPGQTACTVWPGDVNNDGMVNYGDKKSLNTYIHDANLSPIWLTGPARYRVDAEDDPLTFMRWEGQPSVPWATPEGCYMDADGNGVVNNFDYIPIKLNWMRTHGQGSGKLGNAFNTNTFDVSQNFPNPFNPTTQIQYSVPERSHVRIVVMDITGKEVAELVNRTVEAGVHTLTFDATGLSTGVYLGVANMQGLESNLSFSKSLRMTLAK